MKAAKRTFSRRRFLRQTSSAIGAAVAAPAMFSVSALGEWEVPPETTSRAARKYAVLKPASTDGEIHPALADGIPFLKDSIWTSLQEGGSASLGDLHIKARHLYLFGCRYSADRPPYAGGADDFRNLFVGDKVGDLRIQYRSGTVDDIPLLFGYTLWWHDEHDVPPEPFRSEGGKQAILDRALYVSNGAGNGSAPYYVRIGLRDEAVLGIELRDGAGHKGRPAIDGVTFADVIDADPLDSARFLAADRGAMPEAVSAWLAAHSVASNDPMPRSRQAALRDLSRVVYTFPDDIDARTISRTEPVDPEHSFSGPDVKFTGPPEAAILTNVFLENSIGLLIRVDDDTGMVHESLPHAENYQEWVGYLPDAQFYYNDSFTRTHFIALLSNMGFLAKADKAIDYFDRWMMYFPKAYPAIQMGGKPVPGHATVLANKPHSYFDDFSKHGWPTKFKTRDYGNPETDGHGLLMLSRFRAWAKAGRTKEWIALRWEAIHEAAEWVPWCLDNPQLSLSEHGLLYSESEAGMEMESLYCNVPCYFGLLAYAEMAETAGKTDFASRWRAQAERLLDAMNAYFPATLEPWGDVWDREKVTGNEKGWGPSAAMVPFLEAMELYGYDPGSRMPAGWAERTRRTYDLLSAQRSPHYCEPATLGYGQGFMTQSALLPDRMDDATQMTAWMARLCFAPRQPHPYRVPECAMMKSDGSMWARRGDLGNGFQTGGVLMTCHILLGIDDYDASTLKLMPRLPIGWTGVSVHKWPVQVLSSGKSEMVMLAMELTRDKDCHRCDWKLSVDKPVDHVTVRLGPFPMAARQLTVRINRRDVRAALFASGDSKWAWVQIGAIRDSCLIQAQVM